MIGLDRRQLTVLLFLDPNHSRQGSKAKTVNVTVHKGEYQVAWYGSILARERYKRSVQSGKITAFRL